MSKFDLSLYLIADPDFCKYHPLLDLVDLAVANGVSLVQLRSKTLEFVDLLEYARALQDLLVKRSVPLIINDHIEIAKTVAAAGVHLGQSDASIFTAREQLSAGSIVGLSVETLEHVQTAKAMPVDYLGVGPIFATNSKGDAAEPWGLDLLAQGVRQAAQPMVAIGGINATNSQQVMQTGVAGVAILSGICSAKDPSNACQRFKRVIA